MNYSIHKVDLTNERDGMSVLAMMDLYAADPMGDGKPLAVEVKERLIADLKAFPTILIYLAHTNPDNKAVGIAVCFLAYSTFAARPLVNISDFYVLPSVRGRGIGHGLLDEIERAARESGCCKLTLEVQENNQRGRQVYAAAGFSQAVYQAQAGGSLYYTKPLP